MHKVALVTGAGGGIGKGIASELAKAGYDLMIHSARNGAGAEETCRELSRLHGIEAHAVQADLMEPGAVDIIFSALDEKYGRLDLYVNNAGVTEGAPFLKITPEIVDRVFTINLRAAFFCVQSAAKRMVANGTRGNIVIISSNQQEVIMPGGAIYGPIKSALTRLATHASMELAAFGIRVNSISPGYVNSSERMQPYYESSMPSIPLRRWASVEEVGQAVLYLASPAAAFITGSCLKMDGGATNGYYLLERFSQD